MKKGSRGNMKRGPECLKTPKLNFTNWVEEKGLRCWEQLGGGSANHEDPQEGGSRTGKKEAVYHGPFEKRKRRTANQ